MPKTSRIPSEEVTQPFVPENENTQPEALEKPAETLEDADRTTATALESDKQGFEAGEIIVTTGADGEPREDIIAAFISLDGKMHAVLHPKDAGREDETVSLLNVSEAAEIEAREKAAEVVTIFENSFDAAVDSTLQTAGLTGEAAEKARTELQAKKADLIMGAVELDNPEGALVDAVRQIIGVETKGYVEPKPVSLENLQTQLMEARAQVDDAKDNQTYNQAVERMYLVQKAIYAHNLARNPEATREEKERMALEAEGAVTLVPDPIYEKGSPEVYLRMIQLDEEMDAALQKRDELTWTVARDEYNRHMAILPILENAERVKKIEDEVEADIAQQRGKFESSVMSRLSETDEEADLMEASQEELHNLILKIEKSIDALASEPSGPEKVQRFKKLNEARKQQMIHLEDAKTRLGFLQEDMRILENLRFVPKIPGEDQIDAARTSLYHQLRDSYQENPTRVNSYVENAIKSQKTPESTRLILKAFRTDVQLEKNLPEATAPEAEHAEVEPISMVEGSNAYEDTKWYQDLEQAYKENPTRTVTVAERMLAEGGMSKKKRDILEAFMTDVRDGVLDEIHGKTETVATAEAVPEPRFNPYESYTGDNIKDLRELGLANDAEDIEAWKNTFVDVLIALNSLGQKPEDVGLPANFIDLLETKDTRGKLAKFFKAKTDRVKLFEKLADLHYQYIDSGHVDIESFLENRGESRAKFEERMNNIGRLGG